MSLPVVAEVPFGGDHDPEQWPAAAWDEDYRRHNSCPCSPVFRRLSTELVRRITQRYAGPDSIIAWHIGDEYGGACYCGHCAAGFRGSDDHGSGPMPRSM
jgi:beta-galactosidase GanA